jgi:PAS domain S-box-containing protein
MKHKIYCNNTFQLKAKDVALNSLFNLFPINFTWLDKEGYVLGCNQQLLDCLNITDSTYIIGKHSLDIFSKSAWENSQKVIETGNPLTVEETHLNKEGDKSYFLSMKSPMKDCNGKIVGVVNIAMDITERKSMEMNLRQLKEAAELADKVKTEFLTNMRHDLRTPLSGIVTISEFLENSETESTKKSYIQDIKECAESMLTHLNELLDHIKVESGEYSLVEKKFNIHEVLKDVYQMMLPSANSKGLEFTLHLEYIPSDLISDSTRIQRILINLISNAIKFTEKGHVRIFINWKYSENGKGVLEFIIDDSGIGIPEDKKEMVFEKFYRLNPSYEGVYSGSGLGLNIVKKFIQELNGKYELISSLTKGTVFKVQIPCKVPVIKISYAESLNTTDFTVLPQDLSTKGNLNFMEKTPKILLVEDNPIISRISKDLLESLNCKVDIAETGTKALELVNQYHYDLVLMDIGLPDIDGYTVTEKIRLNKNKAISTAPIIAITAHSEDEERQRCLNVGMSQMITKPLTREVAESILSKLSE